MCTRISRSQCQTPPSSFTRENNYNSKQANLIGAYNTPLQSQLYSILSGNHISQSNVKVFEMTSFQLALKSMSKEILCHDDLIDA